MSVQLDVPAVVAFLSPLSFVLWPFIHQLFRGESVFVIHGDLFLLPFHNENSSFTQNEGSDK